MLLAIDVGNTNITMGVFKGDDLKVKWRLATDKDKSADEIGLILRSLFEFDKIEISDIKDVIISSVVPPIMYSLTHAIRKYIGHEPFIVDSDAKTNLIIKYDNPKEVGADRIVNAVGALTKYAPPFIIVDFGTATTFCVINEIGEYLGGAILPGIKISMEALFEKAAKLPKVEISKPEKVIGTNTVTSMQSGVYYGYAGSVDNIVEKMAEEIGADNINVIATGGLARMIAQDSKTIKHIDSDMTLYGLKVINDINKGENK